MRRSSRNEAFLKSLVCEGSVVFGITSMPGERLRSDAAALADTNRSLAAKREDERRS